MKRLLAIFALVIAFCSMAQAQDYTYVKGYVRDEVGEPLIGVIVRSEDNKCCAVTDVYGEFVISNAKPGRYTVSYLGFESYTFVIKSTYASHWMNITLKEAFCITPSEVSLW